MEPICLDSQESYTVGWIAALSNERAAAEAMRQEEHKQPLNFTKAHNDPNAYSWGRIGDHNVVIASLPEGMDGKASAATTASYMLASCTNIRIGLMVGIGAGVPETQPDIHLGDVVVSSPDGTSGGVIQYDLGKSKRGEQFERKGYLNAPPIALLSALAKIRARHERKEPQIERLVNDMLKEHPRMSRTVGKRQAYKHPGVATDRLFKDSCDHVDGSDCSACAQDPDNIVKRDERTEPEIYYGVIASGDQVIKDAKKRQKVLRDACQSCICIEMEAAGLMNSFPCLVIRGICDYADSHKNDIWHNYAAATAAAYARELLEIIDVDEVKKTPKASETVKDTQPKPPLVVDNGYVRQDDLEKLLNRISRLDAELDKLKRELKTNNSPGVQDDLEKLQKRVGELEDLKTSKNQERATSPRIECGHATIIRKHDGSGTRIHFEKPFARKPVVLVTIRIHQSFPFRNQRAYLLHDYSFPASTTEHFVAGCWGGDFGGTGGTDERIEFDWIAVEPNE